MNGIIDKLLGRKPLKFVIVSRSRTGSNLLESYLNSHPAIESHGEMFRELKGRSGREIWDRIHSRKPASIKAVGFKLFYYHPTDSDDRFVWDRIEEDKSVRIIHLCRRNGLRTFLSRQIAEQTDVWKQTAEERGTVEKQRLSLDCDALLADLERTDGFIARTRERFADHPMIEITYEELITAPEAQLKRITELLGLRQLQLQSDMKRQNPETVSSLVSNADEIKSKLGGTKWAYLLELEAF